MAVVGTVTAQIDTLTRHFRVTIAGVTATNTSPIFLGKGYQIGTAVISGTITTGTLQFRGSNDGVTFVLVGPAAISTSPASTVISTPDAGVYTYFFLDATALTAGGPINAVIDFVSQNAS